MKKDCKREIGIWCLVIREEYFLQSGYFLFGCLEFSDSFWSEFAHVSGQKLGRCHSVLGFIIF